jgi:parvulin-like peptidyl-prolyl isomerase
MNWKFTAAILVAVIAGIGFGQLACHSIMCRDAIGRVCGRGHLLALVQSRGIYEADLDRAVAAFRSRDGELDSAAGSKESILSKLIALTAAQCLAADEKIAASDVEHELSLLRSQFRDGKIWLAALQTNGFSQPSLRGMLEDDLRARQWVDRQIALQLVITAEEHRQFYDLHAERFVLPVRLRVSHLFLAAPPETAPEIVDLKKEKIKALAKHIKAGENFSELIGWESEDEASKTRGGDLGYFSAYRMPPDFFQATAKLRLEEMSAPVKTSLGFHIIQATDLRPARQMTFEEAGQEIGAALEQGKRQAALEKLDLDLRTRVRVVIASFGGRL